MLTIWVVCMHPVATLVQGVYSMAMTADDSLLWPSPSECAVLCFHKADSQTLWCVCDEAPQVCCFVGLVHVSDSVEIQSPYQLPVNAASELQSVAQFIAS